MNRMNQNNNQEIIIIAAVGQNLEIGKNGWMPWQISKDLKRFKELTSGFPIIMGRKTFETLKKPLPGRLNIVVTRNSQNTLLQEVSRNCESSKFQISSSLANAIEAAKLENSKSAKTKIFIIGGGQIYKDALKVANTLELTEVKGSFDADTFFPDYSNFVKEVSRVSNSENGINFDFVRYEKY